MKKFIFLIFFVLNFSFIFSKTISLYTGDKLNPFQIEMYYSEKYFEYNHYYYFYNLFNNEIEFEKKDMLTGMNIFYGIRIGILKNYIINLKFLYIYQKYLDDESNNFQYADILLEKNSNILNFFIGLRMPFDNKIKNPVLINFKDKKEFILGIFNEKNFKWLLYNYQIFVTYPFLSNNNYNGSINVSCGTGINFYKDNNQIIDFIIETVYTKHDYTDYYLEKNILIPQVRINYNKNFVLILGVEVLTYANNMFLQKNDKIIYRASINYILSSENEKDEEDK